MNSKYHTRKNYERLYCWLKGIKEKPTVACKDLPDYHLLRKIDGILRENSCEGFSAEELEMELN
jgi:hypothetical protein